MRRNLDAIRNPPGFEQFNPQMGPQQANPQLNPQDLPRINIQDIDRVNFNELPRANPGDLPRVILNDPAVVEGANRGVENARVIPRVHRDFNQPTVNEIQTGNECRE